MRRFDLLAADAFAYEWPRRDPPSSLRRPGSPSLCSMVDHLTSLLYVLLPWNWKTESEDVSIFAASRDQPISSGSNRFAAIAGRTGFAQDSSLEGRRFEPSVPRTSDNAFRDCSTAPAIPLPRQRPAPSRQCAEARRRRAGGHFLGRPLTAVPRCSRQRAMASRERSDVVAITGHDECRRASLECPSLAGVNGVGTPCCVPRL
jgi:hypothetical protein